MTYDMRCACACGCGGFCPQIDSRGRPRRFIHGHSFKGRSRPSRKGLNSPLRTDPPILNLKDISQFWTKINKSKGFGPKGECWVWIKGKDKDGYGTLGIRGRTLRAHRVALFLTTGEWTPIFVLHSCDNPPCCNPSHLSVGNVKINAEQAVERQRYLRGDEHYMRKNPPRGEHAHRSILTSSQVLEIRALCAAKQLKQKEIAALYGVSQSAIGSIHTKRNWGHLVELGEKYD